ncbi:MAG: DUF4453 domain-containing protein [Rhodobacteraceae bacterium]|nr:DUF4453 domain-containing protein [Paracoccaceae bacterium]
MFRFLATILIAATFSTQVSAQNWDYCQDLWFTRNQLFDRTGYCFKSPLGQVVFDNSDCLANPSALSLLASRKVTQIKAMENELSCQVDTSQTQLFIPLMQYRLALEDIPVISEFASGCLQWNGPPVSLLSGHRLGAPVIGMAYPSDDIVWEYSIEGAPDGWEFITVYRGGDQVSLGWSNSVIDYDLCGGLAG